MKHLSRHNRLRMAVSLITGLVALTTVLLAPVSAVFALGQAMDDGHGCCAQAEPEAREHCPKAALSTGHQEQSSPPCQCHVTPDDGAPAGEAVALTSSTVAFGAPVAAQSNLQIDIPLAREPDEAAPTRHLHPSAPSAPLYLLNSVLLL